MEDLSIEKIICRIDEDNPICAKEKLFVKVGEHNPERKPSSDEFVPWRMMCDEEKTN